MNQKWKSVYIKTPIGKTNVFIRQDLNLIPTYMEFQKYHIFTTFIFVFLQVIPFGMFFFAVNVITKQYAVAIDIANFYFAKNIAGRKMVGLRWSFTVDRYRKPCWKFQLAPKKQNKIIQILIFWVVQSIIAFCWVASALTSVYSPVNMSISVMMTVLQLLNLYGFYRCKSQDNLVSYLLPHFQQLQDPQYSLIVLQN